MSTLTDAVAAERFKTALKLHAAGIDLQRQELRRTFSNEAGADAAAFAAGAAEVF